MRFGLNGNIIGSPETQTSRQVCRRTASSSEPATAKHMEDGIGRQLRQSQAWHSGVPQMTAAHMGVSKN